MHSAPNNSTANGYPADLIQNESPFQSLSDWFRVRVLHLPPVTASPVDKTTVEKAPADVTKAKTQPSTSRAHNTEVSDADLSSVGPWRVYKDEELGKYLVIGDGKVLMKGIEKKADACLAAVAPDMHDLLLDLREFINQDRRNKNSDDVAELDLRIFEILKRALSVPS